MLTKDLLQFTHRKGQLVPTFIDESRPALLKVAGDLRSVFLGAVGKTLAEIEALGDAVESREGCVDGLKKLLIDRCEFADIDDEIMVKRWELFRVAQELRDEGDWGDATSFADVIAKRMARTQEQLRSELFSDHPDERRCLKFEDITEKELLELYNRSLLQTLFVFADDVKITAKGASLTEKRAFFRQLKFHSLMSEVAVDPEDATFSVYLSGPLKLFHKSTTYGLRLARFIPNVLHLKEWELEATLQLKNKRLQLKLDSSCKVKPRGRGLTGYTPQEFSDVMRVFNEADTGWIMEPSEDFIHLGRQSYCFPDFDLRQNKGKKRFHIELFHPWHKGQVAGRLNALDKNPSKNLIVGVDKVLMKDKEVKQLLESSPWFTKHGFEFNQFPTPKQLTKILES